MEPPIRSEQLARLLLALIGVLHLCSLGVRAQNCYYPNGDLSTEGDGPCSSEPDSPCCPLNWQCLSNGLCYLENAGYLGRYTCTDRTWKSTNCPQICTHDNTASGNEAVLECSTNNYCCDANRPNPGCCDTGGSLFSLPSGQPGSSIKSVPSPTSPGSARATSQGSSAAATSAAPSSNAASSGSNSPSASQSSESGSAASGSSSASSRSGGAATSSLSLSTSTGLSTANAGNSNSAAPASASSEAAASSSSSSAAAAASGVAGTSTNQSLSSSSSSSHKNLASIIAPAVAVPVAVILAAIAAFCLWRRRKQRKQRQRDSATLPLPAHLDREKKATVAAAGDDGFAGDGVKAREHTPQGYRGVDLTRYRNITGGGVGVGPGGIPHPQNVSELDGEPVTPTELPGDSPISNQFRVSAASELAAGGGGRVPSGAPAAGGGGYRPYRPAQPEPSELPGGQQYGSGAVR